LPTNLPDGLAFDSIFGGVPQTATPAPLLTLAGAMSLLLALVLYAYRRRQVRVTSTLARLSVIDATVRAARRVC
jgi:LPXTG-motif cell wall-anchored protein